MDDFLARIEEKNAQIDATIAKLERDDSRLTSLDLSHDEIRGQAVQERFVKSLKRNTNLTYLNISGTTWEKHGDFITAFTQNMSITKLIMDTKRARALHADVVRILEHYLQLNVGLKQALNGLTSVGISCRSRKLRSLPAFLFNSPNSAQITNLDVSHNKLSELPKDLTKLQSLSFLDASCNRLSSLPPEIGLLSSLTHLNVCTNRIAVLPPSLGLLANLQALNVEENFLHKLPVTLGDCLKLQTLHLDKNQLVTIPPELLATLHSDPTQADLILGYLRNLQKGSKRAYNIKLMFVGNGNVGKTTLLRGLTGEVQITWMQRLAGNSGNAPPSISKSSPNISTDGIDICEWEVHPSLTQDVLPMPDDRLKFNCWDFAGQEVYYTTHQFFLSHRSLYLVIFDMRHPQEEFSRIEYWLQSIISRTSNSPIVVIGTHSGDPMCTEQYVDSVLDEVEQRIRSIKCTKFVQAFAVVDSVQGAGLDTLREKLVGLALEQTYMGEEIPQNYMALQEKIKAIKETGKPTLSWDEFKALAIIDCGISEGDVVGATKFLQNLGVIVYFADEQLKNLVVIDPQFLVDIMATIFTTKNSFVRGGVLNHNAIPHIWREPRFPASIHSLLLSLLQRFEISFSLPKNPGEAGSSLFPSLLPKERPQTDFVWPDDVLWLADSSHVQHDRIFQLEFFPIGLFSRLMVRLLQICDALKYWRYGLVLSNPEGKNGADTGGESASVELHPNDKMLRISVRGGKNPSKVLRMLVETFELLVSKWYNIKSFKRIIPCVHCLAIDKDNQDSDGPYLFSLEDCEREASLGSSSMYCLKANIPIRLDQLVPDVVLSDLESRRIDFALVHLDKELAKGGFGIVYKAKYNNQVVAVKKLIIEETEEGEEDNTASKVFGEFRREVWVMSGLKHPNIVQLLGFCINPLAMVMEFVPSGTLYDFLAKNKDEPLDWPMRLKCASDIAYGMLFLHTLNPPLMHRDFKSPNIMLSGTTPTSNIVCKVTDFGLSSQMWVDSLKEKSTERDIANPTWLAPEVINETEYTVKSDVYSYGIILWELLTRQHPFDEYKWSFMSQLEQLVTDGKRPTIPLDTIPEYAKLVDDCWHPDPKLRPHFSEIVKVLDKLVDQHAPYIPIPAKNKNMNSADTRPSQQLPAAPVVDKVKDNKRASVKKMNATTCVKTLETPNSVWSICVHGNKVWTSHGVDPTVTPKPPSVPSTPSGPINPFTSPPIQGRHTVSAPTSPDFKLPPPPGGKGPSRTVTSNNLKSNPLSPLSPPSSLSKSGPISPLSPTNYNSNNNNSFSNLNNGYRSGNSSPTSASAPSSPPMLLRTQTNSLLRGFSSSLLTRGVSQMEIAKPPNYNELCIWDSESGQLVGSVSEAHPSIINSLLVVNEDVWSGSEDGSIKSWNIQSWEKPGEVVNPFETENTSFSGFLMKKALNRFSQHWQRRWFTLKGTTLIRYKSQSSPEPKESIEIKGAAARPHKRKFCIAITVKSSSKRKNEGCEMLVSAQSQEEYDMWLEKLQAVTVDVNEKKNIELLRPDLVGDMVCGLGAVKCMAIVDGRVWTGTRGGICAFNIEEQRYTGAIKLSKSTFTTKGEELEGMYVKQIVCHNKYVWCAVGASVVRIDPRTRQMIDWFEGHTGPIDDMALFGDNLWSCSSSDHTMRVWNTAMPVRHAQVGPYSVRKLGSVFENYEGMSTCVIANVIWIGGADGNIRVWDPQAKLIQKTLDKKHDADITSIAITNKTVWVTCADGTISVWLVS